MNRAEALDKAKVIVDSWSEAPMKANGYPVDGWKPPTLQERTAAVTQIAEFLWEPAPDSPLLVAPSDSP